MRTECAFGNPARIGDNRGKDERCQAQFDELGERPILQSRKRLGDPSLKEIRREIQRMLQAINTA